MATARRALPMPARLQLSPRHGFVGRTGELAALREDLAAVAAGRGPRVVVVSGEPGAGKTSLLAELAREAFEEGAIVRYGRGEEELESAYGMWRQLLAGRWPLGVAERDELFAAVTDDLSRAAARKVLVAVFDDLQWADADSLRLLNHVAGAWPSPRLLLMAAHRSTEVTPGGSLSGLLASLAREPDVRFVPLEGFGQEEVAILLAAATGRELDEATRQRASRLAEDTRGNAFFVNALLDERGRGPDAGAAVCSESLHRVIEDRVGRLGAPATTILSVAAVLGENFTLTALSAMVEESEDSVIGVVERAIAAGLLIEDDDAEQFSFVHALVADSLLAGLTAVRRRRLHRRAAEVLEQQGASPADIARHLLGAEPKDAASREATVDAATAAGLAALDQLAYEDSVRRLNEAVGMIDRWHLDEGRRCGALVGLGSAQRRLGELTDAHDSLLEAARLGGQLGRWEDVRSACYAFPLLPRVTVDVELQEVLEGLARVVPEDERATRAAVLALLAWTLRYTPERTRAAAMAEQAAALAADSADPTLRLYVSSMSVLARVGEPDVAAGIARAEAALSQVVPGERFAIEAELLLRPMLLFELMRSGALDRVNDEVARSRALAERLRGGELQWQLLTWEAQRQLTAGRLDEAQKLSEAAFAMPTTPGNEAAAGAYFLQVEAIAWLRGQLPDLLEAVLAMSVDFPHPLALAVSAAALALAGRTSEARARLEFLSADGFAVLPRDDVSLAIAVMVTEACRALDAQAEAETFYRWLEPYQGQCAVWTGFCVVSAGAVDRLLGQLAAVCGWNDAARAHLSEAARLEALHGARPFLALTRAEQARLGVPGAAAEARAIAEELGLRLVLDRLGAAGEERSAEQAAFRPEGDIWVASYAGRLVQLRPLRGFEYLRELLARPGREMHVADLQGGGASTGGPVLDDHAKRAFRRRLGDLEAALEEAEDFGDSERAARILQEREALAQELARAVGLGGRDRQVSPEAERARLNVTRAIQSAISRIAQHHPDLGAHLKLSVRTGTFCAYEPDPALRLEWATGAEPTSS